jgi:hypothetical protein
MALETRECFALMEKEVAGAKIEGILRIIGSRSLK